MLYLHLSSRSPVFAASFRKRSLSFPDMLSSPASPSSPILAHQNFPFLFDGRVVDTISHLWRLFIQVVSFPHAKVLVVPDMPWAVCNFGLVDRPARYCCLIYLEVSEINKNATSPSLLPSQSNLPKQIAKPLPQ